MNEEEKSSELNTKLKRIAANCPDKIDKDISSHSFYTSTLKDLRISRIKKVAIALYIWIKLGSLVESKTDLNNTAFCYRDVPCNK